MKMTRVMTVALAAVCATTTAFAQTGQPATAPQGQRSQSQSSQGQSSGQAAQGQAQTQTAAQGQQKPKDPTYEDTVVVSASKTEQKIVDAPATMTVFTPKMIENNPANGYADLMRSVPGMNVTQLSARDINITSRAATSSLSTTQLAILDGRSIYQDFFGFVMWDFMPANMSEIKQIEVVRGPASVVWGANALNGVVNIVTKSPREMRGGTVNIGFGSFNRESGADKGSLYYVNGTFADVINNEWSWKASVGTYSSDPLQRPSGLIPNGTGTAYPNFTNEGTKQPKFDVRLDRDGQDGSRWSFSGGVAGTTGIMESGIGPFKIESGTKMGYGKASYAKNALHVQAFFNALDGNAPNLLSVDTSGNPVLLNFNTKTFDVEVGDSRVKGQHVLTYGGNLRFNRFHLTLAPGETSRTEGGAYLQDEVFLNDYVRLAAGARVDKFSSIDSAVFSPRIALVLKPRNDQTIRVSYNRAFRAPSMINNNLDVTIATPLQLSQLNPLIGANLFSNTAQFLVPTRATGSKDLTEEHIDAFELSYTGTLGDKALLSAAFYVNKQSNEIFFTEKSFYGITTPPAGWTSLPQWAAFGPLATAVATQVWAGVQTRANFPSEYTYKNLGEVTNKGLELGLNGSAGKTDYYVNYSFQSDPVPNFPGLTATQAMSEINLPAKHRINYGLTQTIGPIFYTMSASIVGQTYWQDVLDSRYHGTLPKYATADLLVGARFGAGDKYTLQLRINNINDLAYQQHIFGDVFRRQIVGELKVNLPKK